MFAATCSELLIETPETKYATSGGLSIAYSVSGHGPVDILYCANWTSHIEVVWDIGSWARFFHRLGTLGRLILFDLPGMGLSDPVSLDEVPTIERFVDCVRAVLDAAGCERAVVYGDGPATGVAVPFAAAHPDRVVALVLYGAFARFYRADDYPIGPPETQRERGIEWWLERWGTGRQLELTAPGLADDPYEVEPMGKLERYAASPGVARVFIRTISAIDVRDILPAVHVPTLVLHRSHDPWIPPEHGRYIAERIRQAQYVELPGESHFPPHGDFEAVVGAIRSFLAALPEPEEIDRMLATILVTDIAGSTRRATELGDDRWSALLDEHDAVVREQLARFRGREIRSTGDGFLATFDGAARAIRCAAAIRDGLRPLGLDVRAGVHSGEVEARGTGIDGVAVHIAARVAALAEAGEVLVSQTVKDLTVGARLSFESRGAHSLKGVPGEWHMYAAVV